MFCPLDGEELKEATLGILVCLKCEVQFLPTIDTEGYVHLTWLEKI